MSSKYKNAILKLLKRAERYDKEHLVSSFVDVGPLFTLLSNIEHQILYGRRGTGKTHALFFLANHVESTDDLAIMLDMRTIGSSGGIYSDPSIPLAERATRLLVDTLNVVHDYLLTEVIEQDEKYNLAIIGPLLDKLADSITDVKVVGSTKIEEINSSKKKDGEELITSFNFNKSPSVAVEFGASDLIEQSSQVKNIKTGMERHRVHFGTVRNNLSKIIDHIYPRRLWILLDEWSEIPLDIQPYLADLLRRTIFTIEGITVKIAAIEQRTKFRISDETNYIGIEVGADVAASLNLDEYMVFDNDSENAKNYFSQLIYKHISTILKSEGIEAPESSQSFIKETFTQINAFDEFVRAAEGVPRDAINILAIAAQKANSRLISVPDIRSAAKNWYNRNKEQVVTSEPLALELLRWIIDEVIAHRRARAFLLKSDIKDELIDFLFDSRVLHIVKQGVSAHDQPGIRYNVYSIDYGCYVDLINTSKAPLGLYEVKTDNGSEYIDVPSNDYRAIRRAILNLEEFKNTIKFKQETLF